jgi:hypothetical protein
MPIKRAAQKVEAFENANGDISARNRMPLTYYAIIVVIVLFGINVCCETYEDMAAKFSVSESQSITCMVDFQKSSCNALSLTAACEKILDCVQKESMSIESWPTKFAQLLNFFIE